MGSLLSFRKGLNVNGETQKEISGIYVNLKDHFDELVAEREKRYSLMLSDSQKALELAKQETLAALNLAKIENDRRLEELNNLRKSVESDRLFLVRTDTYDAKLKEYDFMFKGLGQSVNILTGSLTKIETSYKTWIAAIGVFFVLVQVFIRFYK